jgi:transcriptional regulator with XRE-family HTH domain
MSNEREKQVKILQENLSSIRKIAGWTMEELGNKVGVSKQTVSNWEKIPPTPMNLTQYIAIRAVLDHEIIENKNEVLKEVVAILLDSGIEDDEKTYHEIRGKVSTVAAAAAGGVSGAALVSTYLGLVGPVSGGLAAVAGNLGLGLLFGPIGIAGGIIAGATSSLWLKKILRNKNK